MRKKDIIEKRMSAYSDIKYPCFSCGCKTIIIFNRDHAICRWCHNIVFRTKEEYDRYKFKQKLRRVLSKYEKQGFISFNGN